MRATWKGRAEEHKKVFKSLRLTKMIASISKELNLEINWTRIEKNDYWYIRSWDTNLRVECEVWYFEEREFYLPLKEIKDEFTWRWYPMKFNCYWTTENTTKEEEDNWNEYVLRKIENSLDNLKKIKEELENNPNDS